MFRFFSILLKAFFFSIILLETQVLLATTNHGLAVADSVNISVEALKGLASHSDSSNGKTSDFEKEENLFAWDEIENNLLEDPDFLSWFRIFQRRNSPCTRLKPEKEIDKVFVVVGSGIAGLTSALWAFKKGFKVLLVEKRDAFTREHVISIRKYTFQMLLDFIEPWVIPNINSSTYYVRSNIKIKKLQSNLYACLALLRKRFPNKIKISFSTELIGVSSSGFLELLAAEKSFFVDPDIVVGADSSKSAVRKFYNFKVHDQGIEDYAISAIVKDPNKQLTQRVYRQFPSKYGVIKAPSESEVDCIRVVPANGTSNISIICKPNFKEIYESYPSDKRKLFLESVVSRVLKLDGVELDYFSIGFFPINIYHTSPRFIVSTEESGKSRLVTLAGDARDTVNFFFTGLGANKGISDAVAIMNFLNSSIEEVDFSSKGFERSILSYRKFLSRFRWLESETERDCSLEFCHHGS